MFFFFFDSSISQLIVSSVKHIFLPDLHHTSLNANVIIVPVLIFTNHKSFHSSVIFILKKLKKLKNVIKINKNKKLKKLLKKIFFYENINKNKNKKCNRIQLVSLSLVLTSN